MGSRKKYIRRFFWIVVSSALVIAGLLAGIMYFYGDEVKKSLLQQLNKQMLVELSVEDIQFDLFTNFPKASLRFKEVVSKEKEGLQGKSLLKAGEIALLFNVRNIFDGKYQIEKINLRDAFLNLLVESDGKVNYRLFGPGDGNSAGVNINLKKVDFKNVVISYIHIPSQQEYLFRIDAGTLNGEFSSSVQAFQFDGSVFSTHLKSGNNVFLNNRQLTLNTYISIDKARNLIEFREGKIETEGLRFGITGKVETTESNKHLDLSFQVEQSKLSSLLKIIPPTYLKPLNALSLEGDVSLQARIDGDFSGNKIPGISLDFQFEGGRASHNERTFHLTNVQFNGTFTNGSQQTEKTYHLKLNDFQSVIDGGEIKGSLEIINFVTPRINTRIVARANLQAISQYISIDTLENLLGTVQLDIEFRNTLKSFRSFTIDDFISSQTRGSMEISGVSFGLRASPHRFQELNGQFQFNNKDLKIDRFSGIVSGNDFHMQGYFRNILAYAFKPGESIFIDADFRSESFSLDKLLNTGNVNSSEKYRLSFSDRVNYTFDFHIENFTFRKFTSTNNSGTVSQRDQVLYVKNTTLNSMDGAVSIKGSIDGTDEALYRIRCEAEFKSVNIKKLFHDFGNFGQQNLTSDHLNGRVDAQVTYASTLTPYLFVDQGSVYTLADVEIHDGELIGYQPLKKLSKYVREGEFEHVKFSALKNNIRISDEVVYIPQMDIESNRMNLKLSGSHTFDNQIDYHLQLQLAEIIARKEAIEEDLGDNFTVDDGLGNTKLFVSLTGSAEDPVLKYDTREVRNKIASDLNKERETLKGAFRKEFGSKNKAGEQAADSMLMEQESKKDFKIEWEETKPLPAESKPGKVQPGKQQKNQSKEKDFIILWDEENDTIDYQPEHLPLISFR